MRFRLKASRVPFAPSRPNTTWSWPGQTRAARRRVANRTRGWAWPVRSATSHRPHRDRQHLSREIPFSRRWHPESSATRQARVSGIMTRSWVARYYGTWRAD